MSTFFFGSYMCSSATSFRSSSDAGRCQVKQGQRFNQWETFPQKRLNSECRLQIKLIIIIKYIGSMSWTQMSTICMKTGGVSSHIVQWLIISMKGKKEKWFFVKCYCTEDTLAIVPLYLDGHILDKMFALDWVQILTQDATFPKHKFGKER